MKKKSNWFWLAIIGGVLAVCLVAIGLIMTGNGPIVPTPTPDPEESGEPVELIGPVAVIVEGDYIVDAVDLGAVTESYTKVYESLYGGSNTVEFIPGDVRVIEATCPDHVCMGQGWLISEWGMGDYLPISCLPNAMAIYMLAVDDAEAPEVDGVTQ